MRAAAPERTDPPRLSRSDRLQPVLLLGAIGVGLAIGRAAPDLSGAASAVVTIGVFTLITLVMLNINPRNVATTFTQKRFLAAAIALNFVVNPLLAWGLGVLLLGDQPDLRIGFVLFLVTPCIGWYLVFTELAGGNTELGVGLLGINVVLQVALLPFYLTLFVGDASTIGLDAIMQSVATFLFLPATLAGLVRRRWTRQGRSATQEQSRLRVPMLKTVSLAVVVVSMFASQSQAIFDDLGAVASLIAPMVMFFTFAFGMALVTADRLGLPHDQAALLVFTTTSRNSEASLAIAATAFTNPLVALTVAVGPVIELPLLVVMARTLRRRSADRGVERSVG